MITRNLIIRRASDDGVPAATVERDYVLVHVMAAIAEAQEERLVFKGGTALRLCHLHDYRYSADLDFSLVDLGKADAAELIADALTRCRDAIQFPELSLTTDGDPQIQYVGPLEAKPRWIKLDLGDDELVLETCRTDIMLRYDDQPSQDCLVYTVDEIAAEKIRCVIQRQQCRDLFDLHQLFVVQGLRADFIWPAFEEKARHKGIDPAAFAARFDQREPTYRARWEDELSEHLPGDVPHFNEVSRELRRALRDQLRSR